MPMKSQRHTDGSGILTVGELADYLHVHRATIYRLLKRNEIPGFRVGADWRFRREQIDAWREEREIRTFRRRN
jgi:excisionase family DNA binding protein